MQIVWIVRGLFLAVVLPVLFPLRALVVSFRPSAMRFALLALALALLALGIVVALVLGVLGRLIDVIIAIGLIGILLQWPRGITGSTVARLRLAYRGAGNAVRRGLDGCGLVDFSICAAIVVIALVLSLASGLVRFLLTVLVALVVAGVVWKWPQGVRLPFGRKLRLALHELIDELRRRFR